MRQFNSLCSPLRHNVLLSSRTSSILGVSHVPVRYSSLAAIQRGLRNSGSRDGKGRSSVGSKTPGRLTSRMRRDPDWTPPGFTIKKGKKDITDKGPQPMSRKGRFNDPRESFGKKSLVYQLKSGALKDEMAKLSQAKAQQTGREGRGEQGRSQSEPKSFEDKFANVFSDKLSGRQSPRGSGRDKRSSGGNARSIGRSIRRSDRSADRGGSRNQSSPDIKPRSPVGRSSDGFEGQRPESDTPRSSVERSSGRFDEQRLDSERPRWPEGRTSGRLNGPRSDSERLRSSMGGSSESTYIRRPDSYNDRGTRPDGMADRRGEPRRDFNGRGRPERRGEDSEHESEQRPIVSPHIQHTTAASQFLYGRSVIEAALKHSQRKLYQTYVYKGAGRKNPDRDSDLEELARRKGLPINTVTTPEGSLMMAKMSDNRPHNGFILEASPLPQIPLKNLGAVSDDPKKQGFHVELSHQSKEEKEINGEPDFISYSTYKGRYPLILMLDGILDPGNLGAILRTAAFLGVTGVAISKYNSASLTPAALKASSGAAESLPLYSIDNARNFLERSKEAGWTVYATSPAGPRGSKKNSFLTLDRLEAYDPLSTHPSILLMGSEGEGLGKQLMHMSTYQVSIPSALGLMGVVDSLNVSVAAGILCSAFLRKSRGFMIDKAKEKDLDTKDTHEEENRIW